MPSKTLMLLDQCSSIFTRCRGIIAAINACIYKALLCSVSRGCPQQVVRVGFVTGNYATHRQTAALYTTEDRRPTNQLNGTVAADTTDTRDILAASSRECRGVSGVSARMSRGCYEETAVVEFQL